MPPRPSTRSDCSRTPQASRPRWRVLATPTPDQLASTHAIQSLALRDGRVARYLDTAEPCRHPVVFFGGIGTSAAAFSLTEFAREERDRLALRFISVERNGFGATSF